jgi:hypothetical protein
MYAEFYGFAAPAFQLTPDVRFFFESAELTAGASTVSRDSRQGGARTAAATDYHSVPS